jgi:MSHA pilin protein MshD
MRPEQSLGDRQSGFTLLEVLITIIVIGISATAIMGVFISTVKSSADPLIQQQAIAIAEAYMEEIQLKQFCNDPAPPMLAPPPKVVPVCPTETGGREGTETRSTFNDVQDYSDPSVDGIIRNQNGSPINGLSNYSVTVSIGVAELGSITSASGNALRIDISVDHPAIDPITLSSFRTNY